MVSFYYCENCKKKTMHKRMLGWGTFFAVVITFGLWLFVIPFYPIRCVNCGKSYGMKQYLWKKIKTEGG